MAGLAVFLAGRAAGEALLGMSGYHVGLEVVFVTSFADLHADNPITSPNFCREKNCP
jgi:hypothetical protein